MSQSSTKDYSVPALERSIMILNALAEQGEMSISEMHTQLHIPKTTVFVIVNTLERHSLIVRRDDNKYRLGPGLFQWGMSFYKRINIIQAARAHLEQLVCDTPYTAHLAVLIDHQVVYIDKYEGSGFVRFATMIGQILPLHLSGVGKALASGLTDEEIRGIVSEQITDAPTMKSHRTVDSVLEDVAFVRKFGYSIEDEQMEEGVRCIGAPIYDAVGRVAAAISITALSKDLPAIKFPAIGEQIKEVAQRISREIGYIPASSNM